MTTETYSYDGNAENTYDWAVTGGSIQGESSGVGLLSVDVMWSSTGNGLVTVTETDTTGCSGDVAIDVDLLVNSIGELEMMGMALYPNPVQDVLILRHRMQPSDSSGWNWLTSEAKWSGRGQPSMCK